MLTKCAHLFCKTCFSAWMGRERSCPLCKTVLGPGAYTKVTIEKAFSESANVQTIESSAEERFALRRIEPVLLNEVEAIPLGGPSRGSKIDAICRKYFGARVSEIYGWLTALLPLQVMSGSSDGKILTAKSSCSRHGHKPSTF
jgi:hypothetical protein